MEARVDYTRLRPATPTPDGELCHCDCAPPVMLLSLAGFSRNPIHCTRCDGEVSPEALGLDQAAVDAVASWLRTYGSIDALELESGAYEAWAQGELLDPESPANRMAYAARAAVDVFRRCYFRFWQLQDSAAAGCPICGGQLAPFPETLTAKAVCKRDSVVVYPGAE